jgi:hypothetical protein
MRNVRLWAPRPAVRRSTRLFQFQFGTGETASPFGQTFQKRSVGRDVPWCAPQERLFLQQDALLGQ